MTEGPQPRQAVRDMAPYSPPTGGRSGKLRLDFNENTVGCSPQVIEALQRFLTAGNLTIYPEYAAAMSGLASFFGVETSEFTMTNGTDEAIQVMVNTFVDDGDDVVMLRPSYAMYRFYAELAGASVREIEYRGNDLAFPVDKFLDALRPETRAVLIANPNNPTGTGIDRDNIRLILETVPDAAVLIDEAYFEFSGVTVLPWLREYPNLFVTRTFSKVYGMAAMRCGCIFSRRENVRWMKKAQSPYSVNMLAAVAARAAVEDRDAVDELPEHHLHGPGQRQPDADAGKLRRVQRQLLLDPHVAGHVDQPERAVGEVHHDQRQIGQPEGADRLGEIDQQVHRGLRGRPHRSGLRPDSPAPKYG